MPDTIIRINSAPVKLSLFAAQGPAGPAGPAGPNSVTSATTSNGTATLSVSSLATATGSVSGILNVPTAATATSTLQVASTAFVQQELASSVAAAKNLEFLAHNGSGVTIAKGSIVYINGAAGGVPRITKAQANNETSSARTIGFAKQDILSGADGFVIIEGELLNVSTRDSIDIIGPGIQIYLSPTTPGAFTRTKPSAPNHMVYVGVVVTASTGTALNGKILVGIQNGYELNEIHDVSISSPAAKQVIKRNAGSTLWINEAIATSDVTGLDQELSALLPRLSSITVTGTTPAFPDPLVEQPSLLNGKRRWAGTDSSIEFDGYDWVVQYSDGAVSYYASYNDPTDEPWKIAPATWGVGTGTGQPTLQIDPPTLVPVTPFTGTIALAADQYGRLSPTDMIDLGAYVSNALAVGADTSGGFLTAGTGGTLPIARGGTGAITAPLARTALGSTATGDQLFTAASASAARTTLELGTGNTAQFLRAGLGVAPSATIPLISQSSNVAVHAASFTNTGTGAFVSAFESNAPNLTAGQSVYFAVGRNPATNNQFSFGFEYAGNGSTSNKFNINAYGSAALFSVLASGSVGIGTASPTAALHVVKNATSTLTSVFANPAGDVFNQFVASSGTGEYGVWQDALYFQALSTLSNGIRFFIGSTNALQIAAPSGNVGIGTATPASKLTVTGGDIEVTGTTNGLILKTPDGTKQYRVTINNLGELTTTLFTPP